jgi:hypothetical protein
MAADGPVLADLEFSIIARGRPWLASCQKQQQTCLFKARRRGLPDPNPIRRRETTFSHRWSTATRLPPTTMARPRWRSRCGNVPTTTPRLRRRIIITIIIITADHRPPTTNPPTTIRTIRTPATDSFPTPTRPRPPPQIPVLRKPIAENQAPSRRPATAREPILQPMPRRQRSRTHRPRSP